jgi:uncharacterized protein
LVLICRTTYYHWCIAFPNPFIYDRPVPPADLIDREAETRHLFRQAEGSHNSRLQGPRRYGKTSILKKLLTEDADKAGFRTVYVDFLAVTTSAEVARRLHESYENTLKGTLGQMYSRIRRSWSARVKAAPGGVGVEAEQLPSELTTQRLADLLDLPARILEKSGQRTIVVFDEFQDFLRVPGGLDGLLRSKLQHHHDAASYIFCASDSAVLEAHFSDRKRPLFDQARPLGLAPLSGADLGSYIESRFARTGKDPGEALDALLNLVRGHPQRAMLVAHHLWEQTPEEGTADLSTFDAGLEALDRELGERFTYTWNQIAGRAGASRVLKALALSPETLYNSRTLREFELTKGQAARGVEYLKRIGEVWDLNRRPQIIDPLFERWIRERGA